MTYTFSCPKCGEEIEADVDVGEHMVDWAEELRKANPNRIGRSDLC